MALQLVSARESETGFLEEATTFLDSQHSTHPFQYPQWTDSSELWSGNYFACDHDAHRVCFFARCTTTRSLGRMFPRPIGLVISRGPACDDLEIMRRSLSELLPKARQMGYAYVEISPDWVGGEAEKLVEVLSGQGWFQCDGPRASLRLDLTPSADAIFEGFRKTTRYEVRRAERSDVQVAAATRESDFNDFFKVYTGMARRKGFPPDSAAHMLHVMRRLLAEEKRGALLLAYQQGAVHGGVVIVRAGARCWYVWGATDAELDTTINVGHILQWQGILWAKRNGCTEYDFGGYTEGATSGPALFKRGFSDKVVHFRGGWRYVLDQVQYRFCEVAWKARRRITGLFT